MFCKCRLEDPGIRLRPILHQRHPNLLPTPLDTLCLVRTLTFPGIVPSVVQQLGLLCPQSSPLQDLWLPLHIHTATLHIPGADMPLLDYAGRSAKCFATSYCTDMSAHLDQGVTALRKFAWLLESAKCGKGLPGRSWQSPAIQLVCRWLQGNPEGEGLGAVLPLL